MKRRLRLISTIATGLIIHPMGNGYGSTARRLDRFSFGACIRMACPFVYAYEAWGHTYMGCLQKVFDVEIDLELLRSAESTRSGFGAVRARRAPLPMCEVEVVETYASREDEIGCRNPEFHELPREHANFRVFAVVAD